MPVGYLVTVLVWAAGTALTVLSPRRPQPLARLHFLVSLVLGELAPYLACGLLVATLLAAAQGDLATPASWVVAGVAVATMAVLGMLAWWGTRAAPVVERALDEGLGSDWRKAIHLTAGLPGAPGVPEVRGLRGVPLGSLLRRLLWPYPMRGRTVKRVANLSYGDAGRRNLLDVYCRRSRPAGAPVLVYFHGGRFVGGRKNREARPLLHRLARRGWVCVSANYRLRPAATFTDHVVDAKKVLAWVRAHGAAYGADPSVLFVAGSSAGGHLASIAALTADDPAFQPGFEKADTHVTGVVSLYGYYGDTDDGEQLPTSPVDYVRPDAPPFFVTHGDRDTLVSVESAREFVARLRDTATEPVVYAELPWAQHSFDVFHSLRFEPVVDGIEAFTAWVRSRDRAARESAAPKPAPAPHEQASEQA